MKLLVLYNKESKKKISTKKFEYLKKELSPLYDEIIIPDIKDIERTTDYINVECDTVLIIGGDGTVHDVISALLINNIKRNICFIPAGTCNDYSRNFGYKSFKKSIRIIKENNIVTKDVYKINDSYFVYGFASGGISMISYDIKEKEKRKQGKFAYYFRIFKYILKSLKETKNGVIFDPVRFTINYENGDSFSGNSNTNKNFNLLNLNSCFGYL